MVGWRTKSLQCQLAKPLLDCAVLTTELLGEILDAAASRYPVINQSGRRRRFIHVAESMHWMRHDRGVQVERCFNRIKKWRDLATRYAKRVSIYRACLVLIATLMWLA